MPKKIDHEARRRDIAEAAIQVIGDQGIDNTRLVDVARAANATTGSITHYFEGKDALLLAALDHVAQSILYQIGEIGPEADLIGRACEILPVDEEGMRDWRVWLCFIGRAVADPALASINKAYYEEFCAGVAKLIRAQQVAGKLSTAIDPPTTADAIVAAVDGISLRATLEPEDWPAERQRRQLETMLRPLLPAR